MWLTHPHPSLPARARVKSSMRHQPFATCCFQAIAPITTGSLALRGEGQGEWTNPTPNLNPPHANRSSNAGSISNSSACPRTNRSTSVTAISPNRNRSVPTAPATCGVKNTLGSE